WSVAVGPASASMGKSAAISKVELCSQLEVPAMPDRRAGNGLPLFALTLFCSGVAAAIGVLSSPPPERPDLPGLYPQPLGELGYELRSGLVDPLGAAVYVFIAGWIIVAVGMLRCRKWPAWSRRATGWILLTATAALAADWIGPDRLGGPVTGSGGAGGPLSAPRVPQQPPPTSPPPPP